MNPQQIDALKKIGAALQELQAQNLQLAHDISIHQRILCGVTFVLGALCFYVWKLTRS